MCNGQPGPTQLPALYSPSVDFFDLFPHESLLLLVDQTNMYAHQRGKEWDHDTTLEEMRAFLGMLYFIGIHRLPE